MMTTARLVEVAAAMLLCCACSSQGGDKLDGHGLSDRSSNTPEQGATTDLGGAGALGAVCTQQNKTCAAGLKCVFLEAWNAPKGTCVRELTGGCQSWDDARCVVAGANYSVMCGPYSENGASTNICFLLCELNGKSYACPPLHGCKVVNGYNVCLPQ